MDLLGLLAPTKIRCSAALTAIDARTAATDRAVSRLDPLTAPEVKVHNFISDETMEAAMPTDAVHPFFNGKNFVLFLVCGIVLFLAGGALVFDGLKTPPLDQLQRHEFSCPVEVQEDTFHVRGSDIKSYTFTIPGGPKVELPLRTPGREAVLQALTASTPGTICIALVGQALELTLYALSVRERAGERAVLRHEDTFAANRDVTFQAGLSLGGLALAALMILVRRRFLKSRAVDVA